MINNLEVVEYVKETGISYHFDSNVIVLVLFIMVQNVFLYLLYEKYCKLRNDVLTLDVKLERENTVLDTRINKEVFELHNKIDAEVAQNLHFCDLKIEQEFLDRIKVIDAKIEQYNYKHRLRIDEKFIENSLLIEQKVQAQINSIEYEYDEELIKTLDETQTKLIELTETVEKSKINIVPFGTNDYIDFNSTELKICQECNFGTNNITIRINNHRINTYTSKEIQDSFLQQFKNIKTIIFDNIFMGDSKNLLIVKHLLNLILSNNNNVKIICKMDESFSGEYHIKDNYLFNVFMKLTNYTSFDVDFKNKKLDYNVLNDFKNYLKTHNIKSNLLI